LVAGNASAEDAARHAHWGNALVEEAEEGEGHEDDRMAFREELTWPSAAASITSATMRSTVRAAAGTTLDPLAAMAVLARLTASRVRNNE
jgi:hypothetical protein